MKLRTFIALLILCFYPFKSFSDITVNIIMPELADGMSSIEELLYQEVSGSISELEATVTDTLDKPLVTQGFSSAAIVNSPLSLILASKTSQNYSFSLGGSGAIYSEGLDYEGIIDSVNSLEAEDDLLIGVNSDLIYTTLTIPHFSLDVSYLDFDYDDYFISIFTITAGANYAPFKSIRLNNICSFKPLLLQAGLGYGSYSIGADVATGLISESFDMDLDGDGPLPGQSVEIEIDPTVAVSLDTEIYALNLIASSLLSLFETFTLSLGGGVNLNMNSTDIAVATTTEIEVLGYLADLVEESGEVQISGSIDGGEADNVLGYIFSTAHLQLSSLLISCGVLYYPSSGLAAGLTVGVVF